MKQPSRAIPARGNSTAGHGGYAHTNSTYAKVTFHTWDAVLGDIQCWTHPGPAGGISGGVRSFNDRPGALVGDIVAFQTTKHMGAPSGQWSVTLKGKVHGSFRGSMPWPEVLTDGDWVSINVVKNGIEMHLMTGRVDSISVSVQAGGVGEPSVTVTVTGRDLGAACEDVPVYFNPYDTLHNNLGGIDMAKLFEDTSKLAGRPHEIVPNLLVQLASSGVSFGHPPEVPAGVFNPLIRGKWSDGINTTRRVGHTRGKILALSVLTQATSGSLWEFAAKYQNPVMNEMWLDTDVGTLGPHKGYLNFRERPFVNALDGLRSPWFSVPMHAVSCTTIQSLSLSKGKNRLNHIQVLGAFGGLFGSDAFPLFPPAYNPDDIARWGLRRQEFQVPYFSEGDEGGVITFQDEAAGWKNVVLSWNALNPAYWGGIVALGEMRGEIRVGSKIAVVDGPAANYGMFPADGGDPKKAMTFYVEGIQHSWQAGVTPSAQTQLLVTRGYVENRRVPDLTEALTGWKDIGILTPGEKGTLGDYPAPDIDSGVLV